MLLHFLNLTKLACHCHAPSSTELWAANRLDYSPPLECCCTVGNSTREDRNGQEKGFGHLSMSGPVHSLQKEQLAPTFSLQENFKNSV